MEAIRPAAAFPTALRCFLVVSVLPAFDRARAPRLMENFLPPFMWPGIVFLVLHLHLHLHLEIHFFQVRLGLGCCYYSSQTSRAVKSPAL